MNKLTGFVLSLALVLAGMFASTVPVAAWHATSPECEKLDLGRWTADIYVNTKKVRNDVTGVIDIPAGTYYIDWKYSNESQVITVGVCPVIVEVPVEVPVEVIKEVPVEVIREVPVDRVVERVVQAPSPDRYNPSAFIEGPCGDPRVRVTLDNSASTIPAQFKVIYKHAAKNKRIVKFFDLAPGQVHMTDWMWVRGHGNYVRVRDQYQELLAKTRILAPIPWGQGTCVR
jgi:hypothetical protein